MRGGFRGYVVPVPRSKGLGKTYKVTRNQLFSSSVCMHTKADRFSGGGLFLVFTQIKSYWSLPNFRLWPWQKGLISVFVPPDKIFRRNNDYQARLIKGLINAILGLIGAIKNTIL